MKIRGNTVGTTMPRANYNQTDPTKSDYLVGRDNLVDKNELASIADEILAEAKASGEFDGRPGADGKDGQDGYTPVKGIDYFDGKDGQDGYTPVKGTDYFTEEDKAEIAEQAAGLVEIPEGGGGNSVYFSEEEPTDAKTGDFWYDESECESEVANADYIPVPQSANIGHTIVVKAVDENGKPTEWEAVDLPNGGGFGIGMRARYREEVVDGEINFVFEHISGSYEELKQKLLNEELVLASFVRKGENGSVTIDVGFPVFCPEGDFDIGELIEVYLFLGGISVAMLPDGTLTTQYC